MFFCIFSSGEEILVKMFEIKVVEDKISHKMTSCSLILLKNSASTAKVKMRNFRVFFVFRRFFLDFLLRSKFQLRTFRMKVVEDKISYKMISYLLIWLKNWACTVYGKSKCEKE